MEVFVLSELGKHGGRHFCKIEDKGKYGGFNYVVMTLVGRSLEVSINLEMINLLFKDLRKEAPGQRMSMGTAIGIGIQCLQALEDLHGIGYLHRFNLPNSMFIYSVQGRQADQLHHRSSGAGRTAQGVRAGLRHVPQVHQRSGTV
jgi:tau tubulin kinase